MKTKTVTCKAFTKAVNEADRTVEQIVSVFDNVDLGKDRVKQGAFVDSLAEWDASPSVLSAYFSHQWEDPFANLGPVIESAELAPGDDRLPDEQVNMGDGTTKSLRELGGLYVKYQFDPEGKNPFADQVFWLLSQRRITQASFAYDIVDSKRNSDGTVDLLKLRLHEVGPTLLGMNPATTLLAASRKSFSDLAIESGLSEDQVQSLFAAASKDINHTFIAGEDGKCVLCGKAQTAVAHINRASSGDHDVKRVSFTGSIEERQSAIGDLGNQWAAENDIGNGGFYYCYLEATFADRAIFLVEGWEDPIGQGQYFEAAITDNDDGTFSIGEPVEIIVEQTTRPKASVSSGAKRMALRLRAEKAENTAKRKTADTLSEDEDEITDPDNPEAAGGNGEIEEPEVESESEADVNEAEKFRIQADLMILGNV